ncbi:flavin reductase [Saccharopolyspora sp. TS4A08]|uniref:Flavin reductase n=1 Tax=Saccharopolyspora ipomoeae TaxID=3042027 RepID=A0ABT6PGY0_9PSEU|nr:flavin reductase [Saccharopolyspora sp. TS4A08]MDI2027120.1 flavin reductase [Saccharopolyspora sp. TS4A08]
MADLTAAQREFRAAMANLSAGVNIVTTDGPRGRAGITVSAACSVTDEPPTMLVCVHRASRAHDVLAANERACVNVLGSGQRDLALRFAGALPMHERFTGEVCDFAEVPVLRDAAASLIGRLSQVRAQGSHSVMFVEVERVITRSGSGGLVYFQREFHSLAGARRG